MKFNRIWGGNNSGDDVAVITLLKQIDEKLTRLDAHYAEVIRAVGGITLPKNVPSLTDGKKRGRPNTHTKRRPSDEDVEARRFVRKTIGSLAAVAGKKPEEIWDEFYSYAALDIGFHVYEKGKETPSGRKSERSGRYIQTVQNRGKMQILRQSAERFRKAVHERAESRRKPTARTRKQPVDHIAE